MIVAAIAVAFQLSAPLVPRRQSDVAIVVDRARRARLQQDSALASYEAEARQRMSAWVGLTKGFTFGAIGPNRLAARIESVARVGWSHDLGAWGEVIGARSVAPIVGETKPSSEDEDAALVLPYYPGRDRLWPTSELHQALPQADNWIEHPLGAGADSVYEFAIGDSMRIRLPDQSTVQLREIRVRPRRPASRLVVGSLWVDVLTGHLVRAAYRPSTPIDLWPFMEREIGREDRDKVEKFGPFTGVIREIIIDHGLYQGRFWLPRTRVVTADGTGAGGRVTVTIEQSFKYTKVTALAPGQVSEFREPEPDIDPRTGRVRMPVWRNIQQRRTRCRPAGDSLSERWSSDSLARDTQLSVMTVDGVRMRVLLPCNSHDLVTTPALPPSIYATGEELFPETDFNALQRDAEAALSVSRQAQWSPQPWTLHYGIDRGMLRYNRIEGLSAGVMAERELGAGYITGGHVRLGSADRQPNGEVFLQRGNVETEIRGAAFRRLGVANDWGNPLGLGPSLASALFGRDDGFYYRTWGAEVVGTKRSTNDAFVVSWRLFGERHSTADVATQISAAHAVRGTDFEPNIVALDGTFGGAATALSYSWGLDPRGWHASGGTRLESATGASSYGRAMSELTVTRGLGGSVQAIVTGATGSSVGTLPPQRAWYLGGPYTVHGHRSGALSGDAFWLARAELTKGRPLIRPIVFADVGWAGARADWARGPGRIAGAGAGLAMLDGLARVDIARGLRGTGGWRADFYLEIK